MPEPTTEPTPQPPQQEMAAIRRSFLDVSDIEFTPEEDKRLKALLYQARDAEQAGDLQTCLKCLREYKQGLYDIIELRESGVATEFEFDWTKFPQYRREKPYEDTPVEPFNFNGQIYMIVQGTDKNGAVVIDRGGNEICEWYNYIENPIISGEHLFFQVVGSSAEEIYFIDEQGNKYGDLIDGATEIIKAGDEVYYIGKSLDWESQEESYAIYNRAHEKISSDFLEIKELSYIDGEICFAGKDVSEEETSACWNVFSHDSKNGIIVALRNNRLFDIGEIIEVNERLVYSGIESRIVDEGTEEEIDNWAVYDYMQSRCGGTYESIKSIHDIDGEIVFIAKEGDNETLVDQEGYESEQYHVIADPVLYDDEVIFRVINLGVSDSKHAFFANQNERLDMREWPELKHLHVCGEHYRYVVKDIDGKYHLLFDFESLDMRAFDEIREPIATGNEYVYIVRRGDVVTIVDVTGKELSSEYDEIFEFVPISDTQGYVIAKQGDKFVKKVVNIS